MADKLMHNPNNDTQNLPYVCSLQFVVETFGHSNYEPTIQNLLIVPKVVMPKNKKTII